MEGCTEPVLSQFHLSLSQWKFFPFKYSSNCTSNYSFQLWWSSYKFFFQLWWSSYKFFLLQMAVITFPIHRILSLSLAVCQLLSCLWPIGMSSTRNLSLESKRALYLSKSNFVLYQKLISLWLDVELRKWMSSLQASMWLSPSLQRNRMILSYASISSESNLTPPSICNLYIKVLLNLKNLDNLLIFWRYGGKPGGANICSCARLWDGLWKNCEDSTFS